MRLVARQLSRQKLADWLTVLPWRVGDAVYRVIFICARFNPFGILEYWLIDARGEELAFRILQHTQTGYVEAPARGGWQVSPLFGRRFRLRRPARNRFARNRPRRAR